MTRVFGRGQLKMALLQVAAEVGPANGYVIMHALGSRIGGSWQPSPGAIYPALLALEDDGLLSGSDADGGRTYAVTDAGRARLDSDPDVIDQVADRARSAPRAPVTVGAVLDRLASGAPHRGRALGADHVARLEDRFSTVIDLIDNLTAEEAP